MKIAPSLLACDFGNLKQEIQSVEQAGADWLHLDIMDGVFVPNLSIGLPIVEASKTYATCPLDVHLMIIQPEKYIESFIKAGADYLTFHVEASNQVAKTIRYIQDKGAKAGLSLRPGTPVEALEPFLGFVDLVLVMTVEPGFGGQSFMIDQVEKIKWLKEQRSLRQLHFIIEVDGGINMTTAPYCKEADVLVAGTAIFKSADRQQAINTLKTVT